MPRGKVRPCIGYGKIRLVPSSAYTLLSRALLMEGKLDEAGKAARKATELSLTSADPALKLPALIQEARIAMASLNRDGVGSRQALQELHSTIATAHRLGYYQVECEARIALGEFEPVTASSIRYFQRKKRARSLSRPC